MTLMSTMGWFGCSADPGHPPAAGDGEIAVVTTGQVTDTQLKTGPCTIEGESAACAVQTGRVGSVVNCFHGTQTCTGGNWSACGEDEGAADAGATD